MVRKVVPFKGRDNIKWGENKMEGALVIDKRTSNVCDCSEETGDRLLNDLRESGKRLSSTLNIKAKHIEAAIKESRKQWK